MSRDKERDALVEAIIGDIPDLNFDDDTVPVSDEEVAEIDRLAAENPYIQTEEEERRGKAFFESLRQWFIYSRYMMRLGVSHYDFQEWTNLAEKPRITTE